jgi:hypothetical protein
MTPEIDLAGCEAIGVGGYHSDHYADTDDGVCQWCGATRVRRTMTPERQRELEDPNSQAAISIEERREGWHFCSEYDYGLTDGEFMAEDGIACLCGFDRRKVDEYIAEQEREKNAADQQTKASDT